MCKPLHMKKLLTGVFFLLVVHINAYTIDPPTFKYGFGGGINFSNIYEANSYLLYEDMSGTTYESFYSPIFRNLGSQFFFHGEFSFNSFYLAFKPGIYTYKFNKTDEIIFSDEELEQVSSYLLRYIQMPLEVKWVVGSGTFKPFIGGQGTPGFVLRQGGTGNHSFIRPRFSAGPIAGSYLALKDFDIVLTAGYDYGLHVITNMSDRYNTTTGITYSQSDIKQHNLNVSLSFLFSIGEGSGGGNGKSKGRGALDCTYPNARAPKKY